jgi:hypothetical protein
MTRTVKNPIEILSVTIELKTFSSPSHNRPAEHRTNLIWITTNLRRNQSDARTGIVIQSARPDGSYALTSSRHLIENHLKFRCRPTKSLTDSVDQDQTF